MVSPEIADSGGLQISKKYTTLYVSQSDLEQYAKTKQQNQQKMIFSCFFKKI